MNGAKTISDIKQFFRKKPYGENRAVTLDKIWKIEIITASVLLSAFLIFDFWVYQNFILKRPDAQLDRAKVISFKKAGIERASKKIDNYTDFLKNPAFPFVENPF